MMFRKETEFQETEIGEFPKEWKVRRLNEIAELQRGLSYSGREKSKDEIPDGYLFLTLNSIKEGGGLKEDGWTWIKSDRLKERHFVKEGDIVIANTDIGMQRGHILGAPAIVHFPKWYKKDKAVFSMDLSKLLLRISNMDVNFLFYYLSFAQPLARKYYTGTNVWHLNLDSWARDLLIPLPPLEEQKMIANILSMIDSGIETVDRAIAKLEGMKRTLLNGLLTGRIRVREENGKLTFYKETKFQGTEIGEIPKDWKIEMLGHLINYVKGKKPKKLYDQRINENNLPYLTAEYMRGLEAPKWCNPEEDPNIIKVNSDDVIMIWDGSYAGHVFTGFNGALASTMIKIVPKYNNLDKKFMYYYLTISFQRLRGTTIGTGVPHINKKIFEELYIPLPSSVEEQTAIAEILSTVDKAIELYRREKERLLRLRRGLMGVLLTGRVRVVSDVRDVGVVV